MNEPLTPFLVPSKRDVAAAGTQEIIRGGNDSVSLLRGSRDPEVLKLRVIKPMGFHSLSPSPQALPFPLHRYGLSTRYFTMIGKIGWI